MPFGDNGSQLALIFFFFKSVELSSSSGHGHSSDSLEMDAALSVLLQAVTAVDICEGNK